MPVYEYVCQDCEIYFTEIKKVNEFKSPSFCPQCDEQAQKVISAPHLNTMRHETRQAHETNERSAHAPKVKHTHKCGSHCNHQKESTQPAYKQQLNRRPWMLGH